MKFINKIVGDFFKWVLRSNKIYVTDDGAVVSYSQFGEDLIIKELFRNKKKGFYVYVGAYKPKLYSNTYLLYLKGWNGINIDAMPNSLSEFKKIRSRDINIETPISSKSKSLNYFIFEDQAYNGFFKHKPKYINSKLQKIITLRTQRLSNLLKKFNVKKIDLLSIDVEGMDYEVLISNDWKKYKPKVIVVEDKNFSIENMKKSKIVNFLKKKGYTLIGLTFPSLIFVKK